MIDLICLHNSLVTFHDLSSSYIKGDILPCPPNANLSFKTDNIEDTSLRVLGQTVSLPIMENKIGTKTLQLYVWSVGAMQLEECVVSQVAMAVPST